MKKRPSALTETQFKVVCQNSHGAQMFNFFLLLLLLLLLQSAWRSGECTIGNNTYTETTLCIVSSAPDIYLSLKHCQDRVFIENKRL